MAARVAILIGAVNGLNLVALPERTPLVVVKLGYGGHRIYANDYEYVVETPTSLPDLKVWNQYRQYTDQT